MAILIDTNVLFAGSFAKDAKHSSATRLLRLVRDEQPIIPAPVLSELFYLASVRVHYNHAIVLFSSVQNAFQIEPLTTDDMRRMEQIMIQYASAEFDFTDAAIMAQAERLNSTQIATFDRRDFSIFRPAHCEYLELLP